jgi:Fe2+ or Zn2+ uptake regulation protein
MTTALPAKENKSTQAVFEALHHLAHATAQEILDWIVASHPQQKVSLTSVYRGLNTLVGKNKVVPLHFHDGQVRYDLNRDPKHHHHHLVCTQCNAIQQLDVCPVESLLTQLTVPFQVQYHNFEIFGLCYQCQVPA